MALRNILVFVLLCMLFAVGCKDKGGVAQTQDRNLWQDEIDAFAKYDRENGWSEGFIVFVGSSSIRFWDTEFFFHRQVL